MISSGSIYYSSGAVERRQYQAVCLRIAIEALANQFRPALRTLCSKRTCDSFCQSGSLSPPPRSRISVWLHNEPASMPERRRLLPLRQPEPIVQTRSIGRRVETHSSPLSPLSSAHLLCHLRLLLKASYVSGGGGCDGPFKYPQSTKTHTQMHRWLVSHRCDIVC